MKLEFVNKKNKYFTVRQVLKQEFKLSSRLILKLKKHSMLFLNGENTFLDKKINEDDIITVYINFEEDNSNIVATRMNLDILFEDEYLLIVNKPAGVPIHPSMDHFKDSLSSGVKHYFDMNNIHKKIRPVNRLDKNTSGIVIFAKNEYIQERLSYQMATGEFLKEYIAICEGIFENTKGIIDAPISRKDSSIIERCVRNDGERAITEYIVQRSFNNMSELKINLITGRTHQIRVHMAYIGHPIVGDDLYGSPSPLINRQALHAYKVCFIHPITSKRINIFSKPPVDILKILNMYL